MIKGFGNMLKQAQELQERMQSMQAELEELEVEGTAGGGMVRVTLSGKGDMRKLVIDKSVAGQDEVEILEDLVVAAHTDAKSKLEVALREKMQSVTGGLPLPPGMGM